MAAAEAYWAQKAKNKEIREGAKASEESKQAVKDEVTALFNASDANGDGVLDRAEFGAFLEGWEKGIEKRGGHANPFDSDADVDAVFKAFDDSNTDTAGVSLADWWAGYIQIRTALKELAAAK